MPSNTKRVHFADDADVPPTPSPTYSNTSLLSSPGPRTPPTYPHSVPHLVMSPQLHPHSHLRTSSPSLASYSPSTQVQIHYLVASSSHAHPSSQPFLWDLSLSPEHIRHAHPISPEVLAQPATNPPVNQVTISCSLLPWQITVYPGAALPPGSPNGAVVSVGDVIYEIYHKLRTSVKPTEFANVCGNRPEVRLRAEDAYHARCSRLHDARAQRQEVQKGLKRVDLLMNAVAFAGLSLGDKPGVLLMNVRPVQ